MAATVEVHLLAWNEEAFIAYAIRHYLTYASRVVVHDAFSTDRTILIADDLGAEVENWDTGDEFNDLLAVQLKQSCWLGTAADWVIVADCDELIWFPEGAETTLAYYARAGLAVALPTGFEMFSDELPKGDGQVYDEVTRGAVDNKWYGKPVLFSPKRAPGIRFSAGCHEARVGKMVYDHTRPRTDPPCWLLHFHQLGGVERIGDKYDARRRRLSEYNVNGRLGNFKPGREHALEKRAFILANLQEVIKPGVHA